MREGYMYSRGSSKRIWNIKDWLSEEGICSMDGKWGEWGGGMTVRELGEVSRVSKYSKMFSACNCHLIKMLYV